MRKFILLLLTLAWSSVVFCQKVTYKDETIFKDGQPYAKMKKIGVDFSVKTISGKEVIFLKDAGHYYEVIFRDTDTRGFMEGSQFGGAKKIAKNIVDNDLITAEGVNAEGEKRYVQVYNKIPENPLAKLNVFDKKKDKNDEDSNTEEKVNLKYQMVERERKGEISVYVETFQQNFEEIGTYKKENDFHNDMDIYSIYLLDGTKIAEGKLKEKSNEVKLVTLKDNKMHTVYLSKTTFDSDIAKEIAAFLVERYYL